MMSICVVGLVCAVKEPRWPGSHRPPPPPLKATTSLTGQDLGRRDVCFRWDLVPGTFLGSIIRAPPDLSRASSGQDELAERSHAGYIHVSLRNSCHQALPLSTQEWETLLIQQRNKWRNSEQKPCEWWKWWENGNRDLFILMKNAYCQSRTKSILGFDKKHSSN